MNVIHFLKYFVFFVFPRNFVFILPRLVFQRVYFQQSEHRVEVLLPRENSAPMNQVKAGRAYGRMRWQRPQVTEHAMQNKNNQARTMSLVVVRQRD